MENAEEVMQLLEEFSKIKPKDIPRELEDYLGYVAKTGDPVFQWSLIKNLFREKLLNVITDFYESTLTVELPPCPNVETFNYDRMKTSLLERFDTFSGAPFTIQRICELLTNPRKEYNRADKYMRAIEKNILVVSTREPGTKRSLECDSQTETVLNGIPDVKLHEPDVSLLHVSTDLPFLAAPPASNDITVETTEPSSTLQEKGIGHMNGDSPRPLKRKSDEDAWSAQESTTAVLLQEQATDTPQISESLDSDTSLTENEKVSADRDSDRPIENKLDSEDNVISEVKNERIDDESSSDMFTESNDTVTPHSRPIDTDSPQKLPETLTNSKLETDKAENMSDENEVSSTPGDNIEDVPTIKKSVEEPSDSEAEATDASLVQDVESELNSASEADTNSNDTPETDDFKSITISEVTISKSDEVFLECSEITGTVHSPESPDNSSSVVVESDEQDIDLKSSDTLIEECEEAESHPDSTTKASHVETQKIESSSEPDSVSGTDCFPDMSCQNDSVKVTLDQTSNEAVIDSIAQTASPGIIKDNIREECVENQTDEEALSSNVSDDAQNVSDDSEAQNVSDDSEAQNVSDDSEVQSPSQSTEDFLKEAEVQSTSEVALEFSDQDKREESVIQPIPNTTSDSPEQISVEEELTFVPRMPVVTHIEPSCEPEEAMDVDDTSNQMMVSEGENEGEPMDQSDQTPS